MTKTNSDQEDMIPVQLLKLTSCSVSAGLMCPNVSFLLVLHRKKDTKAHSSVRASQYCAQVKIL